MKTETVIEQHVARLAALFDTHWATFKDDIFRVFLDDCLCSLMPAGQHRLPREVSEQELAALRLLGRAYGRAVIECPPYSDILGPVYMRLAHMGHRKVLGQYFSPAPVCDLLAGALALEHDADRTGLQLQEPCSGAGGIALACLRRIAHLPDAISKSVIHLIDLDPVCARMSAVQLLAPALFKKAPCFGELGVWRGDILTGIDQLEFIAGYTQKERVSEGENAACETIA